LSGLIFLIPVVFEIGDRNLWWDFIDGNLSVLHGIEILTQSSDRSLSESQHPKEFREIINIIENNKKMLLKI
jgi:hypothetical protein